MEIDLSKTEVESQVEEKKVIDDGEYDIECIECVEAQNKAGTGTYWKATFKIVDDSKWYNWRVWHYFNVLNQNKKAELISKAQLKQFFGNEIIKPETLVGLKTKAIVCIKDDSYYGKTNNIKNFIFEDKPIIKQAKAEVTQELPF